jgi:hypothetical protein
MVREVVAVRGRCEGPNTDCTVNQSGPVWFLAGAVSSNGPVPLSCTVPPGKAILVPVINAEWSTNEDMGCGDTYQSLLACAAALMNLVTQRAFSIDGVAGDLGPNPQNRSPFRVQSPPPPFTIHAIEGIASCLPARARPSPTASTC